ncbi:hypothetical protein ACIGMX_39070 [Streptomyces aquilus]|uniref:hypothetical protein n=1 Tax=Streptomyces aquilus TaxID=2548456 RepID=UPI0037D06BCA
MPQPHMAVRAASKHAIEGRGALDHEARDHGGQAPLVEPAYQNRMRGEQREA